MIIRQSAAPVPLNLSFFQPNIADPVKIGQRRKRSGGKGGNGGKGAYAFAGTLTVYGGNVSANGGNLGNPGYLGYPGDSGDNAPPTSQGSTGQTGKPGTDGHAYANSVTFEAATYTITDDNGNTIYINSITSLQKVIILSADVEPAPAPAPFPINWNATAKTASIAAMPAGNVTVKVNYYPQATADGAVTAATGAIATTDAPLVTIDADKLTGAVGMMYYVSETNTAPDYTTDGWTTDVPNAKNYTEAKPLYLWYYPLGRVGQTADDIYSDGNMNDEPLKLSVAPLPTYNVYFAENADPNHWTAVPDKNVKQGQKVTVTYTGTRRVMGVNVEKGYQPTITIGDQVYSLMPGETWEHLNERLELGWTIWERDDDIYCVVYNNQLISVSSDGNNWQTLEFRIDSPIDTNKQYKWVSAFD